MNLLDLLSEGSGQMDMNPYLEGPVPSIEQPQEGELNNVVYLPTTLTRIQKVISEAIVQIFTPSLKQELRKKRARTSISSLLESPEETDLKDEYSVGPGTDQQRSINLMFEQLRHVSMHPALLNNHFVSKKMLLLETKARLLSMSGKVVLFNQIVDFLASAAVDYNLLVVTETINELEWIEGSIIGKDLKYNNLSTRRLFDESEPSQAKPLNRDSPLDGDLSSSSLSSFANNSRRKRQHLSKQREEAKANTPRLTIHLVTSRQLYESYMSSIKLDMIFSFDSKPDLTSPSFEMLRSNNKASSGQLLLGSSIKTPVLIPIPVFSIEHLIEAIPAPAIDLGANQGSEAITAWKLHVIGAFAANRHRLYDTFGQDDFFISAYGKNMNKMQDLLLSWHLSPLPKPHSILGDTVGSLQLSWTEEKFLLRLEENFLSNFNTFALESPTLDSSDGGEDVSNYHTFKSRLAVVLSGLIEQLEANTEHGILTVLPQMRKDESEKQLKIDLLEDQISQRYRQLRKLNEDATISDRRFNRAETAFTRLEKTHQENADMLKHLKEVLTKEEADLEKLATDQNEVLDGLEKEKQRLEEELSKANDEGELLREEYQNSSAQAVKASAELQQLKNTQAELNTHLNGPGSQALPALRRKDDQMHYEYRINRLRKENDNIETFFNNYLDKLIKERSSTIDTFGSSSRPSNRISRSATPF